MSIEFGLLLLGKIYVHLYECYKFYEMILNILLIKGTLIIYSASKNQ